MGKQRHATVTITFGDAAKTYPSGGVPLPDIGSFGMVRNMAGLTLFDPDDAHGILWKYDSENRKLRGFIQGVTVSAAGSATLDDFKLNSTGDALVDKEISLGLSNDAGAGTYYLGKLKELSAGVHAVPAQTLYGIAFGW
jgi:hypothetical protein